jgi:two-component system KDP operon response regulator KdpE
MAQVQATLQQAAAADGSRDRGALVIDTERRCVRFGGSQVCVTPTEFELLVFLARHPNCVVPRRAILKAVWGKPALHSPARLWAVVARLRKKIEPDPERPRYLLSDPWVGYRLVTEPHEPGAKAVSTP